MLEKLQSLQVRAHLPVLGIMAFSGCSVNALANLLLGKAEHPTAILWFAALMVELATAWLVYQVVEQTRKVTKSNISKQDRRFYAIILTAFVVLAAPSLGLSVAANALEFGNVLLGFVFPLLSVACAIGAALPDTVARFEKMKADEKAEKETKRQERELDRKQKGIDAEIARMQAEAERKQAEIERQTAEAKRKAQETLLASLGRAAETYRQYAATPAATQAEIAAMLGTSERTIRNHLHQLEGAGLIRRNGGGIEVLKG